MSTAAVKTLIGRVNPKVTRSVVRFGMKISKHSPTILTVSGITAMAASTVTAVKATTKAEAIIDVHNQELQKIEKALDIASKNSAHKYSAIEARTEKTLVHINTTKSFAKLYLPSATLAVGGAIAILVGHKILRTRHLAAVAAYKSLEETFSAYRKRVEREFGPELETLIRQDSAVVEFQDENGKTQTRVETNPDGVSQYARFFDSAARGWQPDMNFNYSFLQVTEAMMNQRLAARGHVFLNEIYDALGFDRTPAGQVVGWVYNDKKNSDADQVIDFGLDMTKADTQRFFNGQAVGIMLDFNVSGPVWDQI